VRPEQQIKSSVSPSITILTAVLMRFMAVRKACNTI
jgi:hypothetical protein